MSVGIPRDVRGVITPPWALPRSHFAWLGAALFVGATVVVAYLFTHPYPAYGAGLYLEIAEQIRAHGYALPETIPGYTDGGVPFAYPPLMFYLAAIVRDLTGIGSIAYARYVPVLFTLAYLVPYYYTARELLASRPKAGLATLVLATAPPTLQWHLSGGGIVRAGAFLLAVTGLYTGVKLFKTGDSTWLVASAVLFGLTVLSHPVYALFFATSYLVLYAVLDHSVRGLFHGALVALGGLVVASPWLWQVVQYHGLDVFTAAAGTHSGIGGAIDFDRVRSILDLEPKALLYAVAVAGGAYLVGRRRFLLPVWVLVVAYVVGKSRFYVVPGAMMAAILLLDLVAPALANRPLRRGRIGPVLAAGAVVLVAAVGGMGVLYSTGSLQTHGSTATQPAFIDDADVDAMEWVQEEVDPDAEFVVLGDAAEWFPHLTERTILLGPWGVEWVSSAAYWQHLARFKSLSHCGLDTCLTGRLAATDLQPDYVYVPKGQYTVRGFVRHQDPTMEPSLLHSERYRKVFENDGVLIYEYVEHPADDGRPTEPDGSDPTRQLSPRPSATPNLSGAIR